MGFWEAIVIVVVVTTVGDAISKIVKARVASRQDAISSGELDEMHRRLDDQSSVLSETQAQMADQNNQIEELHERVEFAERLLSQVRDRPILEPGESRPPEEPRP